MITGVAEPIQDVRVGAAEYPTRSLTAANAGRTRVAPPGKRLLDVALGVAMLIASAPVWVLVAMAIKLEDRGPIFYRQSRWGRGRERIQVFKFRSMVADSDERFGLRQSRCDDARVTHVGRFLRATGLDELPQILSILKGDMSFVGPRPLAIGEIIENGDGERIPFEFLPGFDERARIRPGLTSLATIYLPKDAHPRRKFRYDRIYVRKESVALDMRLIALSFWISFAGRWERREPKT